MLCRIFTAALVLGFSAGVACADNNSAKPDNKPSVAFGTLSVLSSDAARGHAEAWLKSVGKNDEATSKALDTIWTGEDRPLIDKIAESLMYGSPEAKQLLSNARDPKVSAPTEVPAILKDTKVHPFLRANLALAYAKALSNRRVYEESLESLKAVKVEQVADPAQYLFLKAVAEHALIMKNDAEDTIIRLLDDVPDAPERYKMVAALMHFDMVNWKEKDLDWIARKMDNIERRLDLARGGKKTQEMQRQVVARLDEIIKEIENRQKQQGQANGGNCPNGGDGPDSTNKKQGPNPLKDSQLGGPAGPGQVDPKKFKDLAEKWGNLPDKERAESLAELTRDMPPRYREAVESYFRKISAVDPAK